MHIEVLGRHIEALIRRELGAVKLVANDWGVESLAVCGVHAQLVCATCERSELNARDAVAPVDNAIERGGKINQEGNALLVEQEKGHKQWAKYIERLVKDRDLLNMIKRNLHNTVKDKYNLQNVTRDRAEFYRNIVKK